MSRSLEHGGRGFRRVRANPHVYEVNARVFVRRMTAKYGRAVTLATVPEEEWLAWTDQGFDLVWFMGVWTRSPGARRVALEHAEQRRDFDQTLPDWNDDDVEGSPYAIYDYTLDPQLGAPSDLGRVREALHRHGLGLVVDFVPNHLALDHPWTSSHPQRLVRGDAAMRAAHPDWFYSTPADGSFAHGRDPNFAPWIDTAQVNFFSPELRHAHTETVLRIAESADGVRCDMAMLALTRVFERVWGAAAGGHAAPSREFWFELIGAVRRRFPGFVFVAEAYWALEKELLELGFDFAYDKTLYDKLRWRTAQDVRAHLVQFPQSRYVRFIENHDEPRAVEAFGRERSLAAASVLATIPGMRLFHDGQLDGRRVRLPVQLVREPYESFDSDLRRRYADLLRRSDKRTLHEGTWELLEPQAAGDDSHRDLLVWTWQRGEMLELVVINYAAHKSRGRVALPGGPRHFELEAWQVHIEP